MNLLSILRSKSVNKTLSTYFKEKEPSIISFTSCMYTKSIASKIFNFLSTLSTLDYDAFHNSPSQFKCYTSSYLYQPYSYVITGEHSIIPNFKMRDLTAKGIKYREPCKVNWELKRNFKQPTGKCCKMLKVKHVYLTYIVCFRTSK